MRRLTTRDDRGAAAVFIAVLLVPMIGFAAISIDVGAMYLERRELQNGADAAALAAAEHCARHEQQTGDPVCPVDVALGEAERYASANASDGAADIEEIETARRTVTVRTRTATPDGGSLLSHRFARVFGLDGTTVRASATAIYGPVASASAFPLVMCSEAFAPDVPLLIIAPGGHGPGPGRGHGDGQDGAGDPALEDPCPGPGRSGLQLPGGWGWLQNLETNACEATLRLPLAFSQVGITAPGRCRGLLDDLRGQIDAGMAPELVLPMYSELRGQGINGEFVLAGFARFRVHGFFFQAVQGGPPIGAPSSSPPCGPGAPQSNLFDVNSCLYGRFLGSFALDASIDPDAPLDFGMVGAQLIE